MATAEGIQSGTPIIHSPLWNPSISGMIGYTRGSQNGRRHKGGNERFSHQPKPVRPSLPWTNIGVIEPFGNTSRRPGFVAWVVQLIHNSPGNTVILKAR